MLRLFKRLGFATNVNSKSYLSTSSEPWDLASSVCLERKPTLIKNLNTIESKYSKVLSKVEFEMSFKSDHEIRMIKDKLYAEELSKSEDLLDSDQTSLQTGQEFEDESEEELRKFRFAERITEDDIKNNTTSTNRKLSNSLLLFVKQQLGNNTKWVMPLRLWQKGETMRQVAERTLTETCGLSLKTKFLGNSPCGFYKYRYPKSSKTTPSVGMKIFFFKAQLVSGNVSRELCPEFQWLAEHELDPNLIHEDYLRNIKLFLINDDSQNTD